MSAAVPADAGRCPAPMPALVRRAGAGAEEEGTCRAACAAEQGAA